MNLAMTILSGGLLVAFSVVIVWNYRHVRNGEWHTYRHDKMRRWVNDHWQVKDAKDGENDDNIHNFSI